MKQGLCKKLRICGVDAVALENGRAHRDCARLALAEAGHLVVVVYHVDIVASGHGSLKKCWPLVIGCVLRTLQGIPLYLLKLGVSGAVGFDGNLWPINQTEPWTFIMHLLRQFLFLISKYTRTIDR